eukprot:TRINITY_DN5341_c0_g1_i7.p1 TRINITY_DN5341_c0_g1~~TRINITY_DN5341_c0_g1_i7.p1  ORF type:complete len:936 (+),score=143.45 TRINITY_DN5341_c0_g1_i7:150-2957(+)
MPLQCWEPLLVQSTWSADPQEDDRPFITPMTETFLDGTNDRSISNLCERLGDITVLFCEQHESILSALKQIAAGKQEELSEHNIQIELSQEQTDPTCTPSVQEESPSTARAVAQTSCLQARQSDEQARQSAEQAAGAIDGEVSKNREKATLSDAAAADASDDYKLTCVEAQECVSTKGRWSACRSERGTTATQLLFELRPGWQSKIDLARVQGRVAYRRNRRPYPSSTASFQSDVKQSHGSLDFDVPLRPDSPIRICWDLLVMCALVWDLLVMPLILCFEVEENATSSAINWAIRIAWSIDLVLCLITGTYDEYGKLVMKARTIIRGYVKTWFLIDLIVVTVDWTFYIMYSRLDHPGTIIRVSRVVRTVRTLARLWRMASSHLVPKLLFEVLLLDSRTSNALGGVIRAFVMFLVFFHYFACFWYFVSQIRDTVPVDIELWEKYLISMQWTLENLYGLKNRYTDPREGGISILIVLLTFLLVNSVSAQIAVGVQALQSSNLLHEQTACNRFLKRRHICVDTAVRVKLVIRSRHGLGYRALLEEERQLMQCLPSVLQYDLHAEIRRPRMRLHKFLTYLDNNNDRLTRQLAHEAIEEIGTSPGEWVFHVGDSCTRAVLVTRGQLEYQRDHDDECDTVEFDAVRDTEIDGNIQNESVGPGQMLSEIVLWADWEHVGTLIATEECILYGIDHETFGQVVRQHLTAIVHAVKYGKRFLSLVNRAVDNRSDLFKYTFRAKDLDLRPSTPFDHFVFLSHYKQEAGTEATLIREELSRMLLSDPLHPANDLMTPVFVDSEDLDDLTTLTSHVAQSECLVLMLTTGVLLRPWCLIELVTAYKSQVLIVPVEVQSRRLKYVYPDEEFYKKFRTGSIPSEDENILRDAGISLEDCVTAIKYTFTKIACPFSPHKSKAIREAEMLEIVQRIKELGAQTRQRGSTHLSV